MKKFRTALFNGYKKDTVDEYLEDLLQEMDDLRKDAQNSRSADQIRTRLEELEEENENLHQQLQENAEHFNEEKMQNKQLISEQEKKISDISRQLSEVMDQLADGNKQLADKEQQLKQLMIREQELQRENGRLMEISAQYTESEEKLKKYENDYADFMDLMVNMKAQSRQIVTDAQADAEEILRMARKDADEIVTSAKKDAERTTDQARTEAQDYRQTIEKEMEKKQEEEALKFRLARAKISDYLDSMNRSQNKMIMVYEELGELVNQLPLRLNDVFSEKDFELLEDNEEKNPASSTPNDNEADDGGSGSERK